MRVTYLSASGELGGAERSLLDVLSSIRQAEPSWPLHLITAASGPLAGAASALGVPTTVLPFPEALSRLGDARGRANGRRSRLGLAPASGAALRYGLSLRRAIATAHPDVLHSNSLKMHLLAAWTSPRVRPLWHLHDYLGSRVRTARLMRWSARRSAGVIANSESVAADARLMLGERVPVVTMMNAVDLRRFAPGGPRLDLDALGGALPAPAGVLRIGLAATFARWKGHTTFLDAIAALPADLRVRAYVIGGALYQTDGSQYSVDELRAHAARAGIADRVVFTGFVPRADEALRSLDIVVHASTQPEPFGLVIAEAMACGRAVIASDAGGARELFTQGVDALAHEPGNAGQLASRIVDLAHDPDLRARLGQAARATAERRFDRTRLSGELLPIYAAAGARR